MQTRVVMPRTIPCREASRIMWCAWQKGYSSRAVMSVTPAGWMSLEFLLVLDDAAPQDLEAFEIELDSILNDMTVRRGLWKTPVRFSGAGAWAETA